MAVTHRTSTRNSIADTVVDEIDVGATNAQGQLVFQTSGDVETATLPASNPAFGAASAGTATANAFTDDTSATGGVTAKFELQDRNESGVILGSVTATSGGGDIEASTVTFPVGGTIQQTSLTYTAPV